MTAGETEASESLSTVQLLNLPLECLNRASEHSDELFREFRLISSDETGSEVPVKLLELIADVELEYGRYTAAQREQIYSAIARGDEFVDITYQVPPAAAEAVERLDQLLKAADEYCRRGELLTLETPRDLAVFRSWYLLEFSRQIGGAEPTPWSEPDQP